MEIRKEMLEKRTEIETGKEGLLVGRVEMVREIEKWRIMGVYVEVGEMERILSEFEEWIENKEKEIKTVVEGDFNARIKREGGKVEEKKEKTEEIEKGKRDTKDVKINKEGRSLIEFIEKREWMVFNGKVREDKERQLTFTGERGSTVIDYTIGDNKVKKE